VTNTYIESATPEELVHQLLLKTYDGYDPDSEHFRDTPRRFVAMLRQLTDGSQNWKFTTFESETKELVLIRDIRFVSLCAHHIAPFTGLCHIGYVPYGTIAGISKFARHVQTMSRMMTNQEELTTNIADSLNDILDPKGLGVIMSATHSCMSIRGALAHGSTTVTSAMRGIFLDDTRGVKREFMELIKL
jgi:GTP cyclohydrolase IA